MSQQEVQVSDIIPGNLILTYNGPFYVKNIYRSDGDVSPLVTGMFGKCVTVEYTDNKNKCNLSYSTPEHQTDKLDFSVQTPSIFPLTSKIIRIMS
jgi:hypothetical protein